MKQWVLFISLFFSICSFAQNTEQNSFWYKDSKYIVFQDKELEVVCYAEKIHSILRNYISFHFNIFNLTNENIFINPEKITIFQKDTINNEWKELKLMSSKDYYRYEYTPENHHEISNDDFSMNYTYYIKTVEKEVNDSTKTTEKKVVLIPKKIPEEKNILNKTHMSTRYLGKTSLIDGRYASGVLLTKIRYKQLMKELKVVIEINGYPNKEIYINQTID